MKRFSTFLALVLIGALSFVFTAFSAEEPTLSSDAKVYVDFSNGDTANNGLTATTAIKTISGAAALLPSGGTVVLSGKLVVGGSYTVPTLSGTLLITSNDGTVNYTNFEPETNPATAFKMVSGATLTFASDVIIDDVILFQEYSSNNTIKITNNSTLVIGENISTIGSFLTDDPCYMIIEVEEGSTAIIKGGTFQRITGDGTFINEGGTLIEESIPATYTTAANALYAIGIIEECSGHTDALSSAGAAQLIENLTGYEDAVFDGENVVESEFLEQLLPAMGYSDFEDAIEFAITLGIIDAASETFVCGDAFEICVKALDVKMNDNNITVADRLVNEKIVTERALGFAKRIADGEKIVVACVGDSITEGVGASTASLYSYPAQLQKLLGQGFKVINCGKSGSYVMNLESEYNVKAADRPDLWYPATAQYTTLMASSPDIVIVMLGTNDARSMTAVGAEAVFVEDYKKLIADIAALDSNPEIYLSTMIPAVNADITHQGTYYTLPKLIRGIATELDLPLVDTSETLWEYFYAMLPYGDLVHPTDAAYPALATNFYNEVFGHSKALPILEKASGNVVYLSSSGAYNNSGESPESAVDTLGVAVAKLAESGGTIVVCDAVDVSRTHFAKCGGNITITSVYGGTDYRTTNGAQLNVKGILTLLSDVTLENVTLNVVNSGLSINCGFNNFTAGEGVECTSENTLVINAGYRLASGAISADTVSSKKDCTISISSGTWSYIWGGNQRTNSLTPFGTIANGTKLSIYISGGEFVHDGTLNVNTLTGQSNVDGEAYMEISGGKFKSAVSAVCRTGSNDTDTSHTVKGKLTVKITGGEFDGGVSLCQTDTEAEVTAQTELIVVRTLKSSVTSDGFDIFTILDVFTMYGDANDDGKTDLLDVIRVLKYVVGEDVDICLLNSDCNGDGKLDIRDVLCIIRAILNQ